MPTPGAARLTHDPWLEKLDAKRSSRSLPSQSSTLTGRIIGSQAIPATPVPLLVAAAAIPLTWVPWSKSSRTLSLAGQADDELGSTPRKLAPGSNLAARSGWPWSTPLSRIAIVTEDAPTVTSHPDGAPTRPGPHCW